MEFLGAIGVLILLAAMIPTPTMEAATPPAPTTTATNSAAMTAPEPATPEPETIDDDQDDDGEKSETDDSDNVITEQSTNETGLTIDQIFDLANSEGVTSYNGLNQYLKDATGSGVSKTTIKKWKLSRGFINDAS